MFGWIVIIMICILAGTISLGIYHHTYDRYGAMFITVISFALAIIFGIGVICCRIEYVHFEKTFEIQKEQYEQISTENLSDKEKYYHMVDIINVNKKLAEYQASRKCFGSFSSAPASVLDIKPIGIE